MSRAAEGKDGFVLIETLVAFLILALALGTAIQAIGQAAQATRRAEALMRATDVAAELSATRLAHLPGTGRWDGQHADGTVWRLSAQALDQTRDGAPLLAVEIEIWPEGSATPSPPVIYRTFAIGAPP